MYNQDGDTATIAGDCRLYGIDNRLFWTAPYAHDTKAFLSGQAKAWAYDESNGKITRLEENRGYAPQVRARYSTGKVKEKRDLDIALKVLDGATLREVGEEYGISTERVRQILRETGHESRAQESRKKRQEQQAQERLFAEFAKLAETAKPCRVCGYWVLRRGKDRVDKRQTITCSADCAESWRVLRRIIDPTWYRRHQKMLANHILGLPDGHSHKRATSIRWAHKVIAGDYGDETQARYVLPGSKTEQLAKKYGIPVVSAAEFFADGLPWMKEKV